MKITILGHGHLAYVTSACMEQFHQVNVDGQKVGTADLVWVCYDTPVNEDGEPSAESVRESLAVILPQAKKGTHVLVSTQVPVGTCSEWQKMWPDLIFACSPENLRRGHAINDFLSADRIVVGCKPESVPVINELLSPLNRTILLMSIESAEMVKHTLNSFLALSIAFINEISKVSKAVGADPIDVAKGLQSDRRIGSLSYLKPGGPYTNDTLGREVFTLINLDNALSLELNLIPAIKKSNDAHRNNRK